MVFNRLHGKGDGRRAYQISGLKTVDKALDGSGVEVGICRPTCERIAGQLGEMDGHDDGSDGL
jgi:hypothetical protein